MTPYASKVIEEVAEKHHIHPSEILGRCRITRYFAARIEVARRLTAERGYTTNQIGMILNRDHTAVVYYLGRGKKKPKSKLLLPWRKPYIAHLGHARCRRCFFGSWQKPQAPPKPKKSYLAPYAGADCDYVWRETPVCTSLAE